MKLDVKHQKGYILIYKPEHPNATRDGRVFEHRLVIEKSFGRYINPKKELVHHIDKNVANNKISNLQLVSYKEHSRIHAGWKLINKIWFKTCSMCLKCLKVKENFYKRKAKNGTQYSHYCKECTKETSKDFSNYSLKQKLICKMCKKQREVLVGRGRITPIYCQSCRNIVRYRKIGGFNNYLKSLESGQMLLPFKNPT